MDITNASVVLAIIWNLWSDGTLVNCFTIKDIKRLNKDLFKTGDYDASIRPLEDQSRVMQINISMAVGGLYDIDLNNGHMKTDGFLSLSWVDEQLRWNSSLYGGLEVISPSSNDIWNPLMSQQNDLSSNLPFKKTKVAANGDVAWIGAREFVATCDLDMRLYPFDKHTCIIELWSSVSDGTEIQLLSTSENLLTDSYQINGKWDLIGTSASIVEYVEKKTGVPYNGFRAQMSIKRRPSFVILHTSLPLSLLITITTFVTLVPLEGGERVSFSVTLFLTLTYFSTNISENLPQTSTHISVTSINLTVSLFASGVSVVISIVLCKLAEQSNESIQPWLRKLTLRIKRFRSRKHYDSKGRTGVLRKNSSARSKMRFEKDEQNNVTETGNVSDDKTVVHAWPEEERDLTWKTVAEELDYVAFRFSFLVATACLFVSGVVFFMNV